VCALWPGVIVSRPDLAPANAHDLHLAEELLEEAKGWALGDRKTTGVPTSPSDSQTKGFAFAGSLEVQEKREEEPWPRWLTQKRGRIETVISELLERYNAKKVWARDRWHLTSRLLRKVGEPHHGCSLQPAS
jgi:hypothetical protein